MVQIFAEKCKQKWLIFQQKAIWFKNRITFDNRNIDVQDTLVPDICSGPPLLLFLLFSQLVAVLVTVGDSAQDGWAAFVPHYLVLGVVMAWIVATSAGILCIVRGKISELTVRKQVLIGFFVFFLVSLIVAELSFWALFWVDGVDILIRAGHVFFIIRAGMIGAILGIMVMRYLLLQYQWRQKLRAETEARYQALQARIRPHFLFNSLNSIAALIAINPDQAENTVEDLAELFRATLKPTKRLVSLKEEIENAKTYLKIEQLRLAERLSIQWDIPDELLKMALPVLSLQPLIENAVYHGIELLEEGGLIHIHASFIHKNTLQIEVSNPYIAKNRSSGGNRIALDNIQQRLSLSFGKNAILKTRQENHKFIACMTLPAQLFHTV